MPHMERPQGSLALFRQGETELFNDWIGQHFAGDALDFRLDLFAGQSPVQRKLKILSLANALQTLVAHLLKCALNGFALRVENAFLQRDVNVGCHKKIIIRHVLTVDLRRQPSESRLQRSSEVRGLKSEVCPPSGAHSFTFLSFSSRSV